MTLTDQLAAALRPFAAQTRVSSLTEEAMIHAARAALAAYDAQPAAAANEAELADLALDYLHLAQPEFCSMRCPSVGREGTPIPHLPECVSMRSFLDGLPFATPGATISTGLMSKLKKLANYLTDKGEYEATDLIDTVVDRLSADAQPAADDATVERVAARFDHALQVSLVAEALLKGFWFSDEKQAVRAARAALAAMAAPAAATEAKGSGQ